MFEKLIADYVWKRIVVAFGPIVDYVRANKSGSKLKCKYKYDSSYRENAKPKLGDPAGAEADLKRAIELNLDDTAAYYN